MSDEYPGGDPFVDPGDPDAVEREERRREREAKRAQKAAKQAKKEGAPPPSPPKEAPPTKPRTPEQEFWDEPAEPLAPVPGSVLRVRRDSRPGAHSANMSLLWNMRFRPT